MPPDKPPPRPRIETILLIALLVVACLGVAELWVFNRLRQDVGRTMSAIDEPALGSKPSAQRSGSGRAYADAPSQHQDPFLRPVSAEELLPPLLPDPSQQRPTIIQGPAPPQYGTPMQADGRSVVMIFQDAPWDLVLKRVAQDAGLAIQAEQIPSGLFTYVDPRPHSIPEALDILNGYLFSSGYLLVRNQGLLAVYKLESGVPPHFVPLVSPFDLQLYGRNEYLSMEVPLNTIDPIAAAQEAQGLLSPMGRVVPLPHSGRIVVTDFGGNLRQLFDMLWAREHDPAYQPQIVFHLKNVPAVEVARAINEYLMSQRAPDEAPGVIAASGTSPGAINTGAPIAVAAVPGNAIVVAEPTTNCVLVGASHRHLQRIREIIASLDCVPPQVVIQALLVEVDLGNVDELGVELGVQDSVLFDRSVIDKVVTVTETVSNPGTGIATTNQKIISQTAEPGFNFNNQPLGNNISAAPATVGSQGLSNFSVGRVNGDLGYGGLVLSAGSESVSVLLRALSEKRKLDILSRPQIRTLDNRLAEIQIGQQVPVVDGVALTPVGSANPVIRQDQAGIILRVLPRVSPHDEVIIDVSAEKSEFRTGPGSGIPIFTDATNGNVIEAPIKDVSRAKTMVSCMAGQTIILGGMITKGHSVVERKVPIIGDIPYLGALFRYDYEKTARKELLIFLTPYVLRQPSTSDEHMQTEISRVHFPTADAMQLHGPNPAPPEPIDPRGINFDRRPVRDWIYGRQAEQQGMIASESTAPEQFMSPPNAVPMEHSLPPQQHYPLSPQYEAPPASMIPQQSGSPQPTLGTPQQYGIPQQPGPWNAPTPLPSPPSPLPPSQLSPLQRTPQTELQTKVPRGTSSSPPVEVRRTQPMRNAGVF